MPDSTIRIRVRPYADLGRFFPGEGKIRSIEVPTRCTVGEFLARHGVPADEPLTIGINDRLAGRDSVLSEGDVVDVVAPMTGGT